jgi:hypothetical protein
VLSLYHILPYALLNQNVVLDRSASHQLSTWSQPLRQQCDACRLVAPLHQSLAYLPIVIVHTDHTYLDRATWITAQVETDWRLKRAMTFLLQPAAENRHLYWALFRHTASYLQSSCSVQLRCMYVHPRITYPRSVESSTAIG